MMGALSLHVQGAALALQGVDDVESRHGLAFRVFGVGDRVSQDGLQEGLEHSARLLIDEARNALHASAAGQPTDRRLRDALRRDEGLGKQGARS